MHALPADDPPKHALRRTLLAARRALAADAERLAQAQARLSAELRSVLARRAPACIGFYWPMAAEFDARALIGAWLEEDASRRAALPVVEHEAAPLAFRAWRPDSPMQAGRYGIPIPAAAVPAIPDLLLVPCVGFDVARLRLGYGGGYYDRTLAAFAQRPYAVGVAFACGRVDALPREPHDIPLDLIVTDAGPV
jgi:5,10-methenyltetrahydrofolate synthetase